MSVLGPPSVVAIVPVNHLSRVKSRLAPILTLDERRALVLQMAGHVVATLQASGRVEAIVVVSPDPEALAWAATVGATSLRQTAGTLNAGLAVGRSWASRQGADILLIALADLPLLRPEEVEGAIDALPAVSEAGEAGDAWVLAPDRAGKGTNLLVARPVERAPLLFGPASLSRFERAAAVAGIQTRILLSEGTRFDVDLPADVEEARARGLWRPSEERATRLG